MYKLSTDGEFVCWHSPHPYSCGPAALMTSITQQATPKGGIDRVASLAKTSSNGTSIAGLVDAACDLGASALPLRCGWQQLCELDLPIIVGTRTRSGLLHFCVVQRISASSVLLADPARGLIMVPRRTFAEEIWTGEIILMEMGA